MLKKEIVAILLAVAVICSLGIKSIPVSASDFTDFSNAILVESGSSESVSVDYSETVQKVYFKINVPKTGKVKLDFHTEFFSCGYFYLYMGDDSYKELTYWYVSADSDTKIGNKDIKPLILSKGIYYIVYENGGSAHRINGTYQYSSGTVRVSYQYDDVNISEDLDIPNNDSIPTAAEWDNHKIPLFTGGFTFDNGDDKDFYKISIPEKNTYHCIFISPRDCYVYFYDINGNELLGYDAIYNDALGVYVINKSVDISKGDYYIGIMSAHYTYYDDYYSFTLEKVVSQEQQSQSTDNQSTGSNATNNKYSNEWINGKWFNADGVCDYAGELVWKNNSSGWWVEDTAGWYPVNSWQKIDGVWYYFNSSGYMASNEYYGGYWFNSDGSWDEHYYLSWRSNSSGWWVEDKSGWWPSNKWIKIDGCWYFFNGSGYMVTNQYVGGYWIGANGVCW